MTDRDEDDRVRKAEKRRDMKKPSSIRRRNKDKRSGLLSFHWNEDCTTLQISNYRKLRPAEEALLRLLASTSNDGLYDAVGGGLIACFKFKPKQAAEFRALFKLTPIPEECARCEGDGHVSNPVPRPTFPKLDGETDVDWLTRAKEANYDWNAAQKWQQHLTCPSCRGTGLAVKLESEAS